MKKKSSTKPQAQPKSFRAVRVDSIVDACSKMFPSFGGGNASEWSPLSNALKDKPPMFAAGVDIRSVVEFVLMSEKLV